MLDCLSNASSNDKRMLEPILVLQRMQVQYCSPITMSISITSIFSHDFSCKHQAQNMKSGASTVYCLLQRMGDGGSGMRGRTFTVFNLQGHYHIFPNKPLKYTNTPHLSSKRDYSSQFFLTMDWERTA